MSAAVCLLDSRTCISAMGKCCLVPRRLCFDENVRAKEGGSVPFPLSLAVHHQSLAFRARHAKNEAPEEEAGENAYELQMRLDIFVHVLHTIFTHSSLISAVFISSERFYAIFWPLKHRRLSVREYFIIILTTWFLAIIVCAVHNAEHYFHLGLSFYGWVLFPLVFLSTVCVLNIRLQNSPYFCVFKYARAVKG